jgi:hypothetical protein
MPRPVIFDPFAPTFESSTPVRVPTGGRIGRARIRGEGFVCRLSPITGVTPKAALRRRIWLPVMLNTFTVTEAATHNEYSTLSAGDFSQPAMGGASARQMRAADIDTMTVDFNARWFTAHGQNPHELRVRLYEILRHRQPVRILVRLHPNPPPHAELDAHVTFRSISKEVRPGEPESRYMTISIKEWRDPTGRRRSSSPMGGGSSRKRGVSLPTTKKLKATDTLSSLSHEFYGRYDQWRDIRDANGITKRFGAKTPVVKLGGRWKPGAKITIPLVGGFKSTVTGPI